MQPSLVEGIPLSRPSEEITKGYLSIKQNMAILTSNKFFQFYYYIGCEEKGKKGKERIKEGRQKEGRRGGETGRLGEFLHSF